MNNRTKGSARQPVPNSHARYQPEKVGTPLLVEFSCLRYKKTLSEVGEIRIYPSVKDLKSKTRLAKSWMLQIFDTRVDFPVSVQVMVIFLLLLSILLFVSLVRKRRQLGRILTSRHCMIYDITKCTLKQS